MLVLTRVIGESIHIRSPEDTCLVTVPDFDPRPPSVTLLLNRAMASHPGVLDVRKLELNRDATIRLNDTSDITLIDVADGKARLRVNAPKHSSVHRLETYLAITRERPDPDDGPAGARVPRPSSPEPPSLDYRLDEPPPTDDGGAS